MYETPLSGYSKCGGVLIYIADHINYSRRQAIESSDIESIWIKVKFKKKNKSFLFVRSIDNLRLQ